MEDLVLKLVSYNTSKTSITLCWDSVVGADEFVFYRNGVRTSSTWKNVTQASFAAPRPNDLITVQAIHVDLGGAVVLAQGSYPLVTPPAQPIPPPDAP